MLYLYPSNKIETLAAVLAKLHSSPPLSDPFEDELILTQSHGMGVWLKQKISEHSSVACMIETMMPGAFIWRLMDRLLPESDPDTLHVQHFEKSNVRWEIYRRLDSLLELPEFAPVKNYMEGLAARSSQLDVSRIRFKVSELLADNFDAYQNYRADWIHGWEGGQNINEVPIYSTATDEVWQKKLWQSLYPDVPIEQRKHRAAQIESLTALLKSGEFDKAALPQRVLVFGMAAIPVQWLPLFLALGQHIDVHFLFQNPSQFYWGDILSERQALMQQKKQASEFTIYDDHPLLASMGGLGKSYLGALYAYDETDGMQEFDADLYSEPSAQTMLSHIQSDLLAGRVSQRTLPEGDNSIRFARCHSKLREVECLRDYILGVLSDNDDIAAREVIVMAPNIQDYSPYVEAVFGEPLQSESGGLQHLPYALSDHSLSNEEPLIEQLLAVLQFEHSRVELNDLFDLLALEPVRSKVGLEEDQVATARTMCEALNIRWGLSQAHRDTQTGGLNTGDQNTWLFGLRRAIRSYLFGPSSDVLEGYLEFPLRTSEQHEILGKLVQMIDLIEDSLSMLKGSARVEQWVTTVHQLWGDWFDLSELDESVRRLIDSALDSLSEQVALTQFSERVPFGIVLDILRSSLDQEKVSQRFLSGRINFCNLMPMRTVPFKVVCLLGMNEGAYPRHDTVQSFDLTAQFAGRKGDRSRRSDDRYMFLEALLSAEEMLYISYQGFQAKDNSELFPSVLVTEFQEALTRMYCAGDEEAEKSVLEALTDTHRLQPFHRAYYASHDSSQPRATKLPTTFASNWAVLHHAEPPQLSEPSSLGDTTLPQTQTPAQDSVQQGITLDLFEQGEAHKSEPVNEPALELSLREWEQAFASPLAYYYTSQLGLEFPRDVELLPSTEAFELDGLNQYVLARDFTSVWFQDKSFDEFVQELRLQGHLPHSPVLERIVSRTEENYADFRSRIEELGAAEALELRVALSSDLDGGMLSGKVYVSEQGLVDVQFSRDISKRFFGMWARHVAWNVFLSESQISERGESVCVTPSWSVTLPALEAELAMQYWVELCEDYTALCEGPKAFWPRQSFNYLSGKDRSLARAFDRSPLRTDEWAMWERYCKLGKANTDISTVPEPQCAAAYRQAAAHSVKLNEELPEDQSIVFQEVK